MSLLHASWLLRLVAVGSLAGAVMLTLIGGSSAQDGDAVHVVAIDGEIDLGIAPFLERAVAEAEAAGATALLLEIDTPGGRLDAVLQMRDVILGTSLRTVAYVDPTAFSAGALVAIAAEEIYLAPAGVMGAATPVIGGAGQTADPKVIAAVRSTFRATAEVRGRDPVVAEAMVDPDVMIDGLVDGDSLLSLTAAQAGAVGYLDGVAETRQEVLQQAGLADARVVEAEVRLAERAVRLITNPVLASVLVTLGVLLIVGELVLGAFGLASAAGIALLGTFFFGHLLAGLAGWEDVVLVGIGVILILVEVFVVPGFGVPGVLGLAAVLGGAYLAMVGRDLDFVSGDQLLATAATVGIAFVGITIGLLVLLTLFSRRRNRSTASGPATAGGVPGRNGSRRGWLRWFGDGDVLEREPDPSTIGTPGSRPPEGSGPGVDDTTPQAPITTSPSAAAAAAAHQGAIGVALTDLRPAGVASFDGHRVDVVTEGDYLVAGEQVEILHAERYRRVVRRARS